MTLSRLFLLAALAVVFAGCSSPVSDPDAAREAAREAAANGEAREAIRHYKSAAEAGDLYALSTLATIYERGHVRGEPGPYTAIFTLPGQGARWRARYERERDARARSGENEALLVVAQDLCGAFSRNDCEAQPALADSARAIRERLADDGYAPALFMLAFHHRQRGEDAAFDSLLARAEAVGEPEVRARACFFRVFMGEGGTDQTSAARTARHIDRTERCHAMHPDGENRNVRLVGNLRDAARRGNANASAHLDSLRTLGVFERHPHLGS